MKRLTTKTVLWLSVLALCCLCFFAGCEKADTAGDGETAENEQADQQESVTADGLVFTLQNDGESYRVSGTTDDVGPEVTVPATYNGLPVTGIGERAFADRADVQTLTLPDSIKKIGARAFENCKSLKKLTLPAGVERIEAEIAAGCGALEELTVPFLGDSVTPSVSRCVLGEFFSQEPYDGADEVVQTYASGLQTLKTDKYYLPASLRSVTVLRGVIPFGAFSNCTQLRNITLGNGVTGIRDHAFRGCTGLTDMVVPDSVVDITKGAFSGCSRLKHITLPFVGLQAGTTEKSAYQYPLGVIFGTEYYNAGVYTTQYTCENNQTARPVNYVLPASLTSVTVTGGYIPYGAFCMCNGLTKITLGNNVTGMHMNAVVGCTALHGNIYDNAFYLGNEQNPCLVLVSALDRDITSCVTHTDTKIIAAAAFYQCQKLSYVSIWGTVTDIGSYAFWECTALTRVTISGNVTEINDYMFKGCTNLTAVTLSENTQRIGAHAFEGCAKLADVTLPDGVTDIGESAFAGCAALKSAIIPEGVRSIGENTFYGCTALSRVVLPESLVSIGKYAFYGCRTLFCLTIPSGVKAIGASAFEKCYRLVEVTNLSQLSYLVGNGGISYVTYYAKTIYTDPNAESRLQTDDDGYVLYIDGDDRTLVAYVGRNTDLILPAGVTEIYTYAFFDRPDITSVTIPDSVTCIGDHAFDGCANLLSVIVGNGVTSIGAHAFENCLQLADLALPDGLRSLGDYALSNCTALTSVVLPNGLTSLGGYAFSGCTSLTDITIPSSVTSIENGSFRACRALTSITFGGTVAQWGTICKETRWNSGAGDYVVHCTDGDVTV